MGEFAVRLMFKEKTYLKPSKILGQKKRKKMGVGGDGFLVVDFVCVVVFVWWVVMVDGWKWWWEMSGRGRNMRTRVKKHTWVEDMMR